MKHTIRIILAALVLTLFSSAAAAKNLPTGGMTLDEVAKWLQGEGYKAQILTLSGGTRAIASGADGWTWKIYMFDCDKDERCGSFQFAMGLNTNGAFNTDKMNDWSRDNRWARAYVDSVNDPWLEYDVDLTPGGTYELLDDEFATWRSTVKRFHTFLGV